MLDKGVGRHSPRTWAPTPRCCLLEASFAVLAGLLFFAGPTAGRVCIFHPATGPLLLRPPHAASRHTLSLHAHTTSM
ncbi:hypothetical protein VIGAN_09122800 [Vigna angularis var. angularis]|uniref:Uncharacterized protein n=1 Tax=Vigna angularis var. angularis TaxID=157739 RepID=A0A0S3SXK4_PHAAN|nr:hypothetical protein VIGAN_09122800 [Vigna angularis var. angularis]